MKKILMIVAAILTLAVLPLALFGCNGGTQTEEPTGEPTEVPTDKPTDKPTEAPTDAPTEAPTENPYKDAVLENKNYTFTDEASVAKIKRLGRTMLNAEKGICFDHSATGIEFNVVAEGDITADILCEAVNDNEAYLAIYVDGVRSEDFYMEKDPNGNGLRRWANCHVTEGANTVTIATDLEKGEHNIRIVKQTEANYALLSISNINVTGYLLDKPEDKEYYIEIIGDSLTCGMGAAGNSTISAAQGINGADWEDATQGYAFRTVEALNADYSIVSESGIGIASSWFDDITNFYGKYSYKRDQRTDYDFARKPDLVIINLGTNDFYLAQDKDASIVARVKSAVKELINTVHAKYGSDTPILWVSGIWWNISSETEVIQQIDAAINELGGEAKGIYRLTIAENQQNKMGAENHPSIKGHEQTTTEVVDYILQNGLLD